MIIFEEVNVHRTGETSTAATLMYPKVYGNALKRNVVSAFEEYKAPIREFVFKKPGGYYSITMSEDVIKAIVAEYTRRKLIENGKE